MADKNTQATETKSGDTSKYAPGYFDSLIKQVQLEYLMGWEHQQGRIVEQLSRLALYNNQKRDKTAVGDPLLFTVHQTVLASLYNDHLGVEFLGRESGDDEAAENQTALAEFDYDKMDKAILDYFWLWDTLFFGRGLVKLAEFNRDDKLMCPIPELVDPMTWLRDPKADCVSTGIIKGLRPMRFGGREIEIARYELKEDKGYFDLKDIKAGEEVKSLFKRAKEYRDNASGLQFLKNASETDLGDSENINSLEWFTHWKGKKVGVVLANGKSKVIKYTEYKKRFPIIDRPMYPNSHSWDGTNIPDITEDKQRVRSVILNLSVQGIKADLYPMYVYDEKRIKNKSDLLNFGFNKFVGVDGEGDIRGAVQPLNKAKPDQVLAQWILNSMDTAAQKATATPEMQQGQVSSDKRTLGELNLIASKVDTRYSLTAKVFGWSERAFWEQWYDLYKEHFTSGIDEKVIRLVGAMGNQYRPLTKENTISTKDPDIKIESRTVSENNKLKERVMLNAYSINVFNDPEALGKKYLKKKLAKLNGLDPDEVNIVYPATIDELVAEQENEEFLNVDKMTPVSPNDDDYSHLQIHNKAADTKAKAAHVHAHKVQLMVKRKQPELFQSANPQSNGTTTTPDNGQTTPTPSVNPLKVTPSQAAAPTTPMS